MSQPVKRLLLLGPARVDQTPQGGGAEAVPRFRSRRTVGLLGYLVAEGRPLARDLLAALFWPDESPSRGRANLSRELHNLAGILPDCWESDRQVVAFVPSAGTFVDITQLPHLEAGERWGEAAELLSGEFLEGLYLDHNPEFESWLLGERERWRVCAQRVLRRVIDGHTRRGRYTDALHHAQRLLQVQPWDEGTHRDIMRLLAWTGQRGGALRQFESCKRVLRDELEVQPESETVALYQQIQSGKLDLPPQLPAFLTEEKPRHDYERPLFVGRERELAQLEASLDRALAGEGPVVFVTGSPGQGKTALLNAFVRRAMETHPNLLVASGDCNAYSGVGDPYLPYRDLMAMLTGDVEGRWDAGAITRDHAQRLWDAFPLVVEKLLSHGPNLLDVLVPSGALLARAAAAAGVTAPWLPQLREQVKRDWTESTEVEQGSLFQQITNLLLSVARVQPLLLVLDDIQWADTASVSLLFHLGKRLEDAGSRILIACAYRPEEVAVGRDGRQRHPLAKVLREFKRTFGDVWIHLGQAEEREERGFVEALLDSESNRLGGSFRAALYDRTGGHPLFTIDLLRAMQDRGDLLKDEDGAWVEGPTLDWAVLPARVEAVIAERIDRLDPDLYQVLAVASVEGEVFTAQVLAQVREAPERSTLRQLSQELERRHGLVREQEEAETGSRRLTRYRFGHALFQEYLYGQLGQGERQLLHRDVAGALETLYAGQLDQMAVQLAHHYDQAGDHPSAFHHTTLAAERAARLYASDEAITHYARAIQLAEHASPDAGSLAKLYRGRGLASERQGVFDQAHADHTAALQIAKSAGDHQVVWRALLDLGKLWAALDLSQAREYLEAALDQARLIGEPALLAGSLNWMGNWHMNNDELVQAVAYHREALGIFEELGDRPGLASTLDLLGIANLMGGDLEASTRWYDRAIALYRELGDRQRLASSLMGRGTAVPMILLLTSVLVAPSRDPMPDINEGLQIARQAASMSEQIFAHWSIGLLNMLRGDYGRALNEHRTGLHLASEIGHREWVVAIRFSLGILYVELFAPDRARSDLEEAWARAGEMHSPMWIHLAVGALAGAHLLLGDTGSAQACLESVLSPQTPMDTSGKRACWLRRAELALEEDDPALALDIVDRLIASAHGMGPGRVITYLWKLKADALAAVGEADRALSLLQAALENAQAAGERFLLWRLHASLGQVIQTMGRQEAAEGAFTAAREQIDELAATLPDQALREGFRQGAHRILKRAAS